MMAWTALAAIYLLALACERAWREAGEPFTPRIDCALCTTPDLDFVYHPTGCHRPHCFECAVAVCEVAAIREVTR